MKISREQFLELYKDLPEELQYAMSSERTIDATERLIREYELSEGQSSALIEIIGHTLLGISAPSDCEQCLVKAGIAKEKAKKIDQAVNRVIFFPVRRILNELYRKEIEITEEEEQKEQKAVSKKEAKASDKYREAIEKE